MDIHSPVPLSPFNAPTQLPYVSNPYSNSPPFTSPVPTNTVNGELHQINAHAMAIKARAECLRGLIEPRALEEVTDIKRLMRDTHRILESLHRKATENDRNFCLGDVTVQAWQAYQKLVKMEERLKRYSDAEMGKMRGSPVGMETEMRWEGEWEREAEVRPVVPVAAYIPTGAQRVAIERRPAPLDFSVGRTPRTEVEVVDASAGAHFGVGESSERSQFAAGQSWLLDDEEESEYTMTGALPPPYAYSHLAAAEEQRGPLTIRNVDYGDELGDESSGPSSPAIAAGQHSFLELDDPEDGPSRGLFRRNAVRKFKRVTFPQHLAKSRAEVERSCDEEDDTDSLQLNDPARRRQGSMEGYYATMFILCGINDPTVYLPKLRFIKIHEAKALRTWLANKRYIRRSGDMSRMEKLLYLLFVLQEGWRFEKVAVLFSRTPRQVFHACAEVMQGLLELHGETHLPNRQPVCDELWTISLVFFNEPKVVRRATQYYGWMAMDLIKALVTLNMWIGRYRQQGKVALSGPYFHWWRAFRNVHIGG
ncbi:hypothetical protein CC80DRAFT_594473 [Byssothecium circinans]|uniref:Uncharacterized protein n=1 Tax=Byssothecium circinans TaxID=147558 RepID=A0A6A5TRP1_9PLEO|nr:hypothetical protein CC80DRAFT_594473 [Byssothecium circinans]